MSQNNKQASAGFSHEKIETSNFLMIVLTLLVVAVGRLGGDRAAVLPASHHAKPVEGVKPYTAAAAWLGAMSTSARVATTATRR